MNQDYLFKNMKTENVTLPKIQDGITVRKLNEISDGVINSVVEGFEDAIELDIRLKALEEIIKLSRKKIKGMVLNEAEKEKEKYGVKINVRSGYAVYDLESDTEYLSLKNKLKEREQILKEAANSKSLVFVTESGEEIKKPKIKSYTESSVSYTFEK